MATTGIDVGRMRVASEDATRLMRALANPDRLLLLCHLSLGERCVSELEDDLGIVQPTLSQQLTVLRSEGLVTTRREGKWIYYSIRDPNALTVLETLYRLFCGSKGVRRAR